ncbi:hypothetical protein A3Q56_02874 [Intoshia linei]|uniref:Rho GTPase-activating protein n=1 Tax=Intoshia linei TaxID=1819745 RepID=A0A177B543_9BILA|nr:hypothetical protein A3Q56_02874 [Intoshia linei]
MKRDKKSLNQVTFVNTKRKSTSNSNFRTGQRELTICVVGPPNSGKSCFSNRLVSNEADHYYIRHDVEELFKNRLNSLLYSKSSNSSSSHKHSVFVDNTSLAPSNSNFTINTVSTKYSPLYSKTFNEKENDVHSGLEPKKYHLTKSESNDHVKNNQVKLDVNDDVRSRALTYSTMDLEKDKISKILYTNIESNYNKVYNINQGYEDYERERITNDDTFLYWGVCTPCTTFTDNYRVYVIEQNDYCFNLKRNEKYSTYTKKGKTNKPDRYERTDRLQKLEKPQRPPPPQIPLTDYPTFSTQILLYSPEKIQYINRNQISHPQNYPAAHFPLDGLQVDAFFILYDISQSVLSENDKQRLLLAKIIDKVIETKKPFVLVGTKRDMIANDRPYQNDSNYKVTNREQFYQNSNSASYLNNYYRNKRKHQLSFLEYKNLFKTIAQNINNKMKNANFQNTKYHPQITEMLESTIDCSSHLNINIKECLIRVGSYLDVNLHTMMKETIGSGLSVYSYADNLTRRIRSSNNIRSNYILFLKLNMIKNIKNSQNQKTNSSTVKLSWQAFKSIYSGQSDFRKFISCIGTEPARLLFLSTLNICYDRMRQDKLFKNNATIIKFNLKTSPVSSQYNYKYCNKPISVNIKRPPFKPKVMQDKYFDQTNGIILTVNECFFDDIIYILNDKRDSFSVAKDVIFSKNKDRINIDQEVFGQSFSLFCKFFTSNECMYKNMCFENTRSNMLASLSKKKCKENERYKPIYNTVLYGSKKLTTTYIKRNCFKEKPCLIKNVSNKTTDVLCHIITPIDDNIKIFSPSGAIFFYNDEISLRNVSTKLFLLSRDTSCFISKFLHKLIVYVQSEYTPNSSNDTSVVSSQLVVNYFNQDKGTTIFSSKKRDSRDRLSSDEKSVNSISVSSLNTFECCLLDKGTNLAEKFDCCIIQKSLNDIETVEGKLSIVTELINTDRYYLSTAIPNMTLNICVCYMCNENFSSEVVLLPMFELGYVKTNNKGLTVLYQYDGELLNIEFVATSVHELCNDEKHFDSYIFVYSNDRKASFNIASIFMQKYCEIYPTALIAVKLPGNIGESSNELIMCGFELCSRFHSQFVCIDSINFSKANRFYENVIKQSYKYKTQLFRESDEGLDVKNFKIDKCVYSSCLNISELDDCKSSNSLYDLINPVSYIYLDMTALTIEKKKSVDSDSENKELKSTVDSESTAYKVSNKQNVLKSKKYSHVKKFLTNKYNPTENLVQQIQDTESRLNKSDAGSKTSKVTKKDSFLKLSIFSKMKPTRDTCLNKSDDADKHKNIENSAILVNSLSDEPFSDSEIDTSSKNVKKHITNIFKSRDSPGKIWKTKSFKLNEKKNPVFMSDLNNSNYTCNNSLEYFCFDNDVKTLQVPSIIQKCVEYIENNGILFEGIYRVSGNANEATILYRRLLSDKNFQFPSNLYVHTVCSVLKKFLTNLNEPIIPKTFVDELSKNMDKEDKVTYIVQLINKIPPANKLVFKYLIKHWRRLSNNSDINKMTSQNFGICMWPTVFRPKLTNIHEINHVSSILTQTVTILIDCWDIP